MDRVKALVLITVEMNWVNQWANRVLVPVRIHWPIHQVKKRRTSSLLICRVWFMISTRNRVQQRSHPLLNFSQSKTNESIDRSVRSFSSVRPLFDSKSADDSTQSSPPELRAKSTPQRLSGTLTRAESQDSSGKLGRLSKVNNDREDFSSSCAVFVFFRRKTNRVFCNKWVMNFIPVWRVVSCRTWRKSHRIKSRNCSVNVLQRCFSVRHRLF